MAASTVGWKPHSLLRLKPGKNQHLPVSSSVPSEIFPYLVVVIGLENVLVLTKSVVSTPVDLEVKLRIAQGNNTGVMGYCFIFMPKRISLQNSYYGYGDGSDSKVLAVQACGPQFSPQTRVQSRTKWYTIVIPTLKRQRQGDP